MSRRKRRVFTEEQKLAAVEHVRSTGKTVYQAAQDLDLTETALRHWIAEAEKKDWSSGRRRAVCGGARGAAPASSGEPAAGVRNETS